MLVPFSKNKSKKNNNNKILLECCHVNSVYFIFLDMENKTASTYFLLESRCRTLSTFTKHIIFMIMMIIVEWMRVMRDFVRVFFLVFVFLYRLIMVNWWGSYRYCLLIVAVVFLSPPPYLMHRDHFLLLPSIEMFRASVKQAPHSRINNSFNSIQFIIIALNAYMSVAYLVIYKLSVVNWLNSLHIFDNLFKMTLKHIGYG